MHQFFNWECCAGAVFAGDMFVIETFFCCPSTPLMSLLYLEDGRSIWALLLKFH